MTGWRILGASLQVDAPFMKYKCLLANKSTAAIYLFISLRTDTYMYFLFHFMPRDFFLKGPIYSIWSPLMCSLSE